MKPILEVRNIWKQYKIGGQRRRYKSLRDNLWHIFKRKPTTQPFWALQDINFDVYEGECIGIIGRNGAGKSTLLKILSRITPPTKGHIKARGRIASLLEVGTGFHPELTGRENIYLNGSILGLRKVEIDHKFDEIVDFSGVEQFLDTPLKHYSSGMQLRLAFSVAAHLEPEILLIDEVLAVGDAAFQKKCLGKMNEVSQSGRTVLFVSHNIGAIQQMCKKSVLLRNGSLQKIAITTEIINLYNKNLKLQINRPLPPSLSFFNIKKITLHLFESSLQTNSIISGQKVFFRIEYENLTKDSIKDFNIGFAIFNKYNQFLTVLNNKMANQSLPIQYGRGTIYCILDKAPFIHGYYSIHLTVKGNGQILHAIHDAFSFFVEEGDYYNSGFSNAWKRNGLYIPQNWTTNA